MALQYRPIESATNFEWHTEDEHEKALLDELHVLALGQYFATTFKSRVAAYGLKLPGNSTVYLSLPPN